MRRYDCLDRISSPASNMNEGQKLGERQRAGNSEVCEGNRAPAVVRYSPKHEAAGHGCCLWVFRFRPWFKACATAVRAGICGLEGCRPALGSPWVSASTKVCDVGQHVERHSRRERHHRRKRTGRAARCRRAMPGHGAVVPVGLVACGGAQGCRQRSKVSMTTMRPPQQGHGGRASSGSTGAAAATGGATPSSWRACSRCALRVAPASRP